MYNKYSKKNIW